ncbi:MAG TPA: hypothetical protein VGX91_01190 [Candidatus Cybelea sp.]|jgi:DNA-binding beta-propeller fold protein YncE|nr:hypothetical protein [Candidatus Cybelea sp.]
MAARLAVLALCAVAALAAGCGVQALGGAPPEAAAAGWIAPEARVAKRLIYIANGNDILVLPDRLHDPSVIGRITAGIKGPQGLCVDRDGNLYVANGWGNTVTVYPQGSVTPSRTYSDGLNNPEYPAVDRHGNLFVSNWGGTVVEFRHGEMTASRTLSVRGNADGLALDVLGDVFVTYRTAYRDGGLEEFTPGSQQGRILPIPLDQPQGLLITRDGTIVVVQTGNADGLYVIDPNLPRGNQFPRQVKFHVHQTPVQVALSSDERKLYISEFGWSGEGSVYDADYPLAQNAPAERVLHERFKFVRHGPHRHYSIQGLAISDALVP